MFIAEVKIMGINTENLPLMNTRYKVVIEK